MTLRRLFVGSLALATVLGWSWSHPGGKNAAAGPADAARVAEAEADDGNRPDQERRFRTNQPRHWRHVMVGTR